MNNREKRGRWIAFQRKLRAVFQPAEPLWNLKNTFRSLCAEQTRHSRAALLSKTRDCLSLSLSSSRPPSWIFKLDIKGAKSPRVPITVQSRISSVIDLKGCTRYETRISRKWYFYAVPNEVSLSLYLLFSERSFTGWRFNWVLRIEVDLTFQIRIRLTRLSRTYFKDCCLPFLNRI